MKTHRTLTPEFKFNIVLESLQKNQNQSELARQHNIHPQLITSWKKQLLKEGSKIFAPKKAEAKKNQKVEELEKIIGRQTIEIQFLKKILGHLG